MIYARNVDISSEKRLFWREIEGVDEEELIEVTQRFVISPQYNMTMMTKRLERKQKALVVELFSKHYVRSS